MNKLSPLVRIPLLYGAIAGALGAVVITILYYLGRHPFLFPVYFDFRVILFSIFIFFTLKEYRDFYQDGFLFFWEGMIQSFIIVVVFTIIVSLYIFIFGLLEHRFVAEYIMLQTQQLKLLPADVIEKIGKLNYQNSLDMLPTITAGKLAGIYIGQSFLIGLFISIIISVILRRQPKN